MSLSIFTIGRDRMCNFVIADDSVSRLHAELRVIESQSLVLTDLKSTNGTYLIRHGRSERIQKTHVSSRDTIQFGAMVVPVGKILDVLSRDAGEMIHTSPSRYPQSAVAGEIACRCGGARTAGYPCPLCGNL